MARYAHPTSPAVDHSDRSWRRCTSCAHPPASQRPGHREADEYQHAPFTGMDNRAVTGNQFLDRLICSIKLTWRMYLEHSLLCRSDVSVEIRAYPPR